MIDPGWIEDLVKPFWEDNSVAMAGHPYPSNHPTELGFRDTGQHFHIQGGLLALRTDVIKRYPYDEGQFAHWGSDIWQSYRLMEAGFLLQQVPSIISVWREKAPKVLEVRARPLRRLSVAEWCSVLKSLPATVRCNPTFSRRRCQVKFGKTARKEIWQSSGCPERKLLAAKAPMDHLTPLRESSTNDLSIVPPCQQMATWTGALKTLAKFKSLLKTC